MPFLRFTRDKRGYETIALVHAVRRNGRSRNRILYWFRTPPGVKVGRPALDEDAIRSIEEQNPDIEFDWPKILEAKPPAPPRSDDVRDRRVRRDRNERRRQPKPPQPSGIPREAREQEPVEQDAPETDQLPDEQEPEAFETLEAGDPQIGDRRHDEGEPLESEALEQLTHPETEEHVEPVTMPVEQTFGPEQLTRLRARYAELLARITERAGSPERMEALRAQAEPLNPDAWVTEEEVRKGIASFEGIIRDLRGALGLRRRRRSRRGGRRRRQGAPETTGAGSAPPAQAETPDEPSNEG